MMYSDSCKDGRKTAICILNYNGSQDTIDCVRSILEYESDHFYRIFILDNGSNKDKYEHLASTLEELYPKDICKVDLKDALREEGKCDSFLNILRSDENLGFAAGNNSLIELALRDGYDYVLLQNNDTVLIESSLSNLLDAVINIGGGAYYSTDIRYFDNECETWNAGGEIIFGSRKYYRNNDVDTFLNRGIIFPEVSFLTGCYLLIPRKTLLDIGKLSTRFFFGEEDYEYALRVKEAGLKGRVLLSTKILHKVSRSSVRESASTLARGFIHRLNRTIDMRLHYNPLKWMAWKTFSAAYLYFRLVLIEKISVKSALNYIGRLYSLAGQNNGVSQELFSYLMEQKNEYFTARR